MVPSISAVSGMMLLVVPAVIRPTVTTAGSNAGTRRVTRLWIAVTSSQATGIGSTASWGMDACPPRPVIRTTNRSAPAISGPARLANTPVSMLGVICRAKAASGNGSSSPSSSMKRAPCQPSSPGWNMNITVPARLSRWAASARAAPTSIATCVSCPQACMAPCVFEAKSSPVSSVRGRASMSPRRSTVRPLAGPRSTATNPVVDGPSWNSSGRPASASRAREVVMGRCSPISGSA